MITKESILRKHLGEDLFKDMSEWLIFPQPSGSFPMIDLIYSAMYELIQEDRKNVADHARVLYTSVRGSVGFSGYSTLDKDSIINAPNI